MIVVQDLNWVLWNHSHLLLLKEVKIYLFFDLFIVYENVSNHTLLKESDTSLGLFWHWRLLQLRVFFAFFLFFFLNLLVFLCHINCRDLINVFICKCSYYAFIWFLSQFVLFPRLKSALAIWVRSLEIRV